jgi:exodeoxyribonuclease V gamma subunit
MSAPDFRLYHGNDPAVLAGVLAAEIAKPAAGAALLMPDTILIPQPGMKRWLQNSLAERHGIAANLRFLTPGEFVRDALAANLPGSDDAAVAQADILRWRLWEQLATPMLLREPVFAPLRAVLAPPGESRAVQAQAQWALAGELAAAFEKYQAWRRDWLQRWDRGADRGDWQAELWRRATEGLSHRGARLSDYLARHGGPDGAPPRGLPARLFAFACQNVSPDVLRVIASAALAGPLHFFFVSPVAGWWGDLRTARERLRDAPDLTFAADDENPLLRANGAAGRDFVRVLFDPDVAPVSFELPVYEPPDRLARPGLLHRLQRDLLARRAGGDTAMRPHFDAAARADASLQFHASPTRLRELQVLHDRLRALLDADSTLQPRDIAVLAPDIGLYAPQVHAVFGASAGERDFIPYAVADTGAADALPMVAAFLRVLELPSSRFGVNEVLDLLALAPVAQRLGLARTDLARLREALSASGVRWGLDAAHRVAQGAPEDGAYTWAWALERLLLGHATASDTMLEGAAPLPLLEGGALERLDALLQGLRTLARLQRELDRVRDAAQWQLVLLRAIEDLFPAVPEAATERRSLDLLRDRIAHFAAQAQHAGIETPIPPAIVRDWFAAALGEPEARQPFLTGGVTFARMVPMRLIPFRVICVLGMNDAAYPRRDPVGGLNRIDAALGTRERRPGDRALRDEDRGLFLQLFGAATDVFYLSWIGRDARSGEALTPSVVVSELLDVAAEAFDDTASARAALVLEHPLQPFAPGAFGDVQEPRRFSYRAEWRVEAAPQPERIEVFAGAHELTSPSEAPTVLLLDDLRRDLQHPARAFLRHALGLQLDTGRARLPEDEPFGRDDPLRQHALKQRLFAELIAAPDLPSVEDLRERLLAEGWIAPAADGERDVSRLRTAMLGASAQWRRWAIDAPQRHSILLDLGDVRLEGALSPVHAPGLLQFRAGKPHGRNRLDLALDALCWCASGETRAVHRLVLEGKIQVRPPLDARAAHNALTRLIALQQRARTTALPLMPQTAWSYVEALAKGKDEATAFAAAARTWSEHDYSEARDPWVRLALRGRDPFVPGNDQDAESFRSLARALFAALHEPGGGDDDAA